MDVLSRFELYLTAMAIAGSCPLRGAQAVPMVGDTSVEVVFPYDLALRFKWMVEEAMGKVSAAARRAWLLHMLEEEQAHWVYSVQFSSLAIGQIVAQSLVERRPLWFTPNAYSQPPPLRYEEPPPTKRLKPGGPKRQPIFPPSMTVAPLAAAASPRYQPSAAPQDRAAPKGRRLASSAIIKGKSIQLCCSYKQSICEKTDCKYEHRCSMIVGTRADGSDIVCVNAHPACQHGAGRAKAKGKGKGK